MIGSLIPTNLKVGYFSKGIQGGHLVCLMKWMRIFIYCKQHKRNAINSEKNCCWQDFDALRIQISVAASGHWRNPGIIYQGRDAYWCLSSCTDVHIYYIPFPGDVSRRGVCAPGKWHTEAERSHRIRWLAISAQLLFVRWPCHFRPKGALSKKLGQRGAAVHASRALRVPVQAVVFAKIVFVVTQTRPDRHAAQLKMQAQQESGAPIHKSLQCNRNLCIYILSLCLCLAVSGGVRHWHVCLHRHSHRKWCNPM